MKLRFMKCHMAAQLPKRTAGGLELIPTMILDNGDTRTHQYGLFVAIPDGYVGMLMPIRSITDKIEKIGAIAIYTDQDAKRELSLTFALPDDMVHDYYQPGEVSAMLMIVPVPRIETEIVNMF